jgi:hypothetical protein
MLQFSLGTVLIVTGLLLFIVGGLLVSGIPLSFLGRLPGDIRIERPGIKFYLPLTTCILLSMILSAILFLVSKFK